MAQIGVSPALTTTEAVRAALGMDHVDLSDDRIIQAGLDKELRLDLFQWYPNALAAFTPAEPVSVTAQMLKEALESYSKYFCAAAVLRNPAVYTQMYSDGKAEQRRFTNMEWGDILARTLAELERYRSIIATLVPDDVTLSSVKTPGLVGISSPNYNPVTNSEGGV